MNFDPSQMDAWLDRDHSWTATFLPDRPEPQESSLNRSGKVRAAIAAFRRAKRPMYSNTPSAHCKAMQSLPSDHIVE